MEESNYINQVYFNNDIQPMNITYNICKATIKIILSDGKKASGFFMKFKRLNKSFYCIITNQHVIKPNIYQNTEIIIKYDNENKTLKLKLDEKERFILYLKDLLNLDMTIVEIIYKDNIDESFFLLPVENETNYYKFLGRTIQVAQYPYGLFLSMSEGIIQGIAENNKYILYHNADTDHGSSGAPIVLKGENRVLAIHRGATPDHTKNIGVFIIGMISDIITQLQRNGKGVEYYKNGKVKYEGDFKNDEYHGNGTYYFENGEVYYGEFYKGKRHGNGIIFKDNKLVKGGQFKNDKYVNLEQNKDFFKKLVTMNISTIKAVPISVKAFFRGECKKCFHKLVEHIELENGIWLCRACQEGKDFCDFNN